METALRLAPGRSLAYYSIAMTLVQKGDPQAALAAIQKEPGGLWRLGGLAVINPPPGPEAASGPAPAGLIQKYAKEAAWDIALVFSFPRPAHRPLHGRANGSRYP